MTAVSDTSTSSPARWSSPFDLRSTQPSPLAGGGGHSSESTIVTAAAAAAASAPGGSSPRSAEQAAEGRVARPARRRARASRKAPVTLLNTDTTNFRAMVQQFTGFPAAAAPAAHPPPPPQYAPSYPLRPGFGLSIFNDPPPPPPVAHFLQRPQYLEQQPMVQYQFPEAAMWSNNNSNTGGGGSHQNTEAFLPNSGGLSGGNLEAMAHAAGQQDAFLFGGQMSSSSSMRRGSGGSASRAYHDEYYS